MIVNDAIALTLIESRIHPQSAVPFQITTFVLY